jgi:ribosome-associated heat shock protein Hsp15
VSGGDTANTAAADRAKTRLDQWLWFARFVKSRSLAARLCAAGAVSINGSTADKPSRMIRTGDVISLTRSGWQRTVRVAALGERRGPAVEARLLYEEIEPLARLSEPTAGWEPLLDADETAPFG